MSKILKYVFQSFSIFFKKFLTIINAKFQRFQSKRQLYSLLITSAKSDSFDPEMINEIKRRCDDVQLSITNLKPVRSKVYKILINKFKRSGEISYEQEQKLNFVRSQLYIPEVEIKKELSELSRYRLLNEIKLGNLPTAKLDNIILQKEEIAHWSERAQILEEKIVSRRYVGGSQGMSIRIAKGVSYRVGNHRGRLITDKALLAVSEGQLVITNKRIIFRGGVKSFDVKLNKLLSFNFADDGLIFTIGTRSKPYVVKFENSRNMDIVKATFAAAIEKCAA